MTFSSSVAKAHTSCRPQVGPTLRQHHALTLAASALQQKVASFHLHSKLVEILQPPHTRSRAGAWLLAVEYLLQELPPQDLSASIQGVPMPIHAPCLA